MVLKVTETRVAEEILIFRFPLSAGIGYEGSVEAVNRFGGESFYCFNAATLSFASPTSGRPGSASFQDSRNLSKYSTAF